MTVREWKRVFSAWQFNSLKSFFSPWSFIVILVFLHLCCDICMIFSQRPSPRFPSVHCSFIFLSCYVDAFFLRSHEITESDKKAARRISPHPSPDGNRWTNKNRGSHPALCQRLLPRLPARKQQHVRPYFVVRYQSNLSGRVSSIVTMIERYCFEVPTQRRPWATNTNSALSLSLSLSLSFFPWWMNCQTESETTAICRITRPEP